MTCIVGLVDGDKTYIGGDSAGVAGLRLTVRADRKIFRNGNYLMGFTTSFRMGQLLRYKFEPPRKHPEDDFEKFLSTDFVEKVRSCLKSFGFSTVNNNEETGGTFLVAAPGCLARIDSDFQVGLPVHNYDAVGSGGDIALGALHATEGTELSAETRVLRALEAAQMFNAGVRAPFHIEHVG